MRKAVRRSEAASAVEMRFWGRARGRVAGRFGRVGTSLTEGETEERAARPVRPPPPPPPAEGTLDPVAPPRALLDGGDEM